MDWVIYSECRSRCTSPSTKVLQGRGVGGFELQTYSQVFFVTTSPGLRNHYWKFLFKNLKFKFLALISGHPDHVDIERRPDRGAALVERGAQLPPPTLGASHEIINNPVRVNVPQTWSSLVEGDEGCIGPSGELLCSSCMTSFHTFLTVGPMQP